MKTGKFKTGAYVFAAVGGLVSGLWMSAVIYQKGKCDALDELREDVRKFRNGLEDILDKKEANEEA